MKKFIILTLISFLVVGCSKGKESEDEWKPTKYEIVNNLEGVAMLIEEETVTSTRLTVLFENGSSFPIFYGEQYTLEKKKDGIWYQLPALVSDDHYDFADIGYELAPSHSHELQVNLGMFYGNLHKGEYRIVKNVLDIRSSRGYGAYDEYYLSAEFIIK